MARKIRYFVENTPLTTKYATFGAESGAETGIPAAVRRPKIPFAAGAAFEREPLRRGREGEDAAKIALYFFAEIRQNDSPVAEGVRCLTEIE